MQDISIKKEFSSFSLFYRFLDLLVIMTSAVVAYFIYFNSFELPQRYLLALLITFLLSLVVFSSFDLHKTWRGSLLHQEIKKIILAWGSVFLLLTLLVFITKSNDQYSRGWFLIWFFMGLSLDLGIRGFIRKYLSVLRRNGQNHRDIIIIAGEGDMGLQVVNTLYKEMWTGLNVAGYFTDNDNSQRPDDRNIHIAKFSDLAEFLTHNTIYQIWITMPLSAEKQVKEILHSLRFYSGDIKYIPDFYGFNLINHSFSEIAGIPIVNLTESPFSDGTRFIKSVQDFLFSMLILILISPLMLLIAIGIKITSRGPVFYQQKRVSWNNSTFNMLKFRTMPVDVEQKTGAVWAQKGEKRTTSIGGFLRKTSLDELPQFINVLKGDMSIVGPRPERPFFVEQFKEEIPLYMKKHMVKAGITGWAQVNGLRGNTDIHKRIKYDIYYIEHWSFWLDLKIIFLTIFKGFVDKNAY